VNSSSKSSLALEGQWALITGAGRRIGASMARILHEQGMNIAIHYRGSAQEADTLAAELNAERADSAITVQADLLDTPKLPGLVNEVIERTGRLDLLGTNLKAPLFLAKAAAPHLKKSHGNIINIVDIHAQRPLGNHPVYGPAKAGLAMLTRSLAKDLAPDVRVNGVSPGAILWPEDGMPEKVEQAIIKQVPLKRTGEPADIAKTVLFLIKDAHYITGQIIAVDGGRSIGW